MFFHLLTGLLTASAASHFTGYLIATATSDLPGKYAPFCAIATSGAENTIQVQLPAQVHVGADGTGPQSSHACARLVCRQHSTDNGVSSARANTPTPQSDRHGDDGPARSRVTGGQKLRPQKGLRDHGADTHSHSSAPVGLCAEVPGLNSISLPTRCSAAGHRLQGSETQAIKQIHAHLKQKLQSNL